MVEQAIKPLVYPVTPTKVGLFMISIISIILIIVKVMLRFNIGINSSFYATLSGFTVALPFFLAIALTLIFFRWVRLRYEYLIISFIIFLIIGFVFISPILEGGI